MTTKNELIQSVETILGQAIDSTTANQSATYDLFEAYVFSLVIEAAKLEGATISYRNISGNVSPTMIFRTSPGYISSSARQYTYAIIDFPGQPRLEAHIGIFVAGKSNVPHECDVAVLYSDEAETCRRNIGVLPRHSKVIIAAECKFYTSGLTLGLGRGFLGLLAEISYRHGGRYFVTNTSSASIEKLLTEHAKDWGHDVVPTSGNDVNKLRGLFQKRFEYYKARNF